MCVPPTHLPKASALLVLCAEFEGEEVIGAPDDPAEWRNFLDMLADGDGTPSKRQCLDGGASGSRTPLQPLGQGGSGSGSGGDSPSGAGGSGSPAGGGSPGGGSPGGGGGDDGGGAGGQGEWAVCGLGPHVSEGASWGAHAQHGCLLCLWVWHEGSATPPEPPPQPPLY